MFGEEARNNQIRFGSTSSAIYHMAMHGSNEVDYLNDANRIISIGKVSIGQKNSDFIKLTFVDTNSQQKCFLIVISNGRIILATCY